MITVIVDTGAHLLQSSHINHYNKQQELKPFSLIHTTKRLFENRTTETDFIHAIRVKAEQVVVIIHIRALLTKIGLDNPMKMECDAHQFYTAVFAAFVILIQNFFLLSGFLSFYINAKGIILSGRVLTRMDFIELIVKRIVRLIPLMALMILFNATLPIWTDIMGIERQNCRKNWWTNLLFVNNIYRTDKPVRNEFLIYVETYLELTSCYLTKHSVCSRVSTCFSQIKF